MSATLIESSDEHHWVLLDHRIAELTFDGRAVRLRSWSLGASLEIRIGTSLTWRPANGAARTLAPDDPETLAPLLTLVRRQLSSVTIGKNDQLTLAFGDGSAIEVAGRLEGWRVDGGGSMEGINYPLEL